ncbi:hypothetical protein GCM10011391_35630 [Pullulanibacillus camelliae]|uniref:DNA-binding response regulator n=2 Tax=Pullulanibacillus camelliae TaxID=1707096 RepID=A0A8J2YM16_9BACL|nr:hypothetical protein GCM10011391_35630 [Pullulanibacillus camelliae]
MKAVIIDDERAVHLILRRMLEKIDHIDVIGSFQETTEAFAFIKAHAVDIAFIDINMPKESGLDFAKRIREKGWQMKLVFVTSHKEFALPAFDVYAYDYIVKPISQERLKTTISRAVSEETVKAQEEAVTPPAVSVPNLVEPLTKREKEILQLMSQGMSNKEIATTFSLSEGTVKNHVVNIFGKLQVKNRVQAAIVGKAAKQID